MTRNGAVRILIRNAARSVAGTGTGIRPRTTDQEAAEVKEAIRKMYFEAYGLHPADSDFFNLGL